MAILTALRSSPSLRRRLLAAALVIATLVAASAGPCAAAEPAVSKAAQVEAAFLYNFAKFIEWPTTAFATSEAPITIGVLGEDPFGAALDELGRGELIRGRPLAVKRSARLADLTECHILFISASESAHATEILKSLGTRPILTVSDIGGFGQAGGMIQFYLDGTKLRFLINPTMAQNAELKMSAQLLSVGKLISLETNGKRD